MSCVVHELYVCVCVCVCVYVCLCVRAYACVVENCDIGRCAFDRKTV